MSDVQSQLAMLRALRDAATDPAQRSAFDAAIAALEATIPHAPPPPQNHNQTIAGHAQVGVAIDGDMHGNIYLNGTRGKTAEELLRGYLLRVVQRCGSLPLQGVREQKAADDVLKISLDQVYTQLVTYNSRDAEIYTDQAFENLDLEKLFAQKTSWNLLPKDQRIGVRIDDELGLGHYGYWLAGAQKAKYRLILRRREFVTELIIDNNQLVLLGEPGGGKSTALRYIALTLAEAGLDDSVKLADRLEGWDALGEQGKLLPIFLPLLPLAKRLANETGKAGNDQDVWNEIVRILEPGGAYSGLVAAVRDELEAGRVLLMLDGLDEVAGAESRRRVVRAVRDFATQHPTCRIVVACRVRAYEGEQNAEWQLPDWPTATLADWTLGQMTYFIDAWYHAAASANTMTADKRDERIAALKRALDARDDLRKLGVRPLLLTIMALVHLNYGSLPEDRVSLYSRCIDILLSQWEKIGKDESEYGALMDYIKLPDTDVKALRPLLMRAAFVAHEASDGENLGRIDRSSLRTIVADGLEVLKHANPHQGAKLFLEYTDVRAGLLQASDAGDAYVFPHQTFQEYLAGLELFSGVQFVRKVMDKRSDDRWRVPIFLGLGHTVSEGLLAAPHQLLSRLLHEKDRDAHRRQRDFILTAELAADVGWARLERGADEFSALRQDLAKHLVEAVEGVILPAAERVYAGVLLGQLGDPRPGVCSLPPAMVPISGGTFFIGEAPGSEQYADEVNQAPLRLASFELARYLVTNAQYALFLADEDAYNPNKPWWGEVGRAWLRDEKRTEPSYWHDSRFGQSRPNHPVVGVSLYEARAFAAWLTEHSEFNPGRQWIYQLPSEAEWEYAARGTTRRAYPWGSEDPDAERANFRGTYDGTTAVGCFPQGATEQRIYDLAGNVLEWTRSLYIDYPYDPNDGREQPDDPAGKYFTLRGGGWDGQPLYLRASCRSYGTPDYYLFNVGFRLARHLPGKD